MTVCVVGATGTVGRRVLDGVVASGESVRATTRHPERATLPRGVQVFRADFSDPESFEVALRGADRVFVYADMDDPKAFVEVATGAGVRHVVVLSSVGATAPHAETSFHGSGFVRVEHAVEEAGLDHTFLRPGTFASNASRWSWGIRANGTVALPYPDSAQAPIHEQDIADVAVVALTTNELVGAAPTLTGPSVVTLREEVADIGAAIGRDLAVVEQSEAESRASLARFIPSEWIEVIMGGWREGMEGEPEVSEEYTRITGRPGRDFAQWAHDNASLFR